MELRFEDLTEDQKKQAKARFFNASKGDGYWYLINRGDVFSRNRVKQTA